MFNDYLNQNINEKKDEPKIGKKKDIIKSSGKQQKTDDLDKEREKGAPVKPIAEKQPPKEAENTDTVKWTDEIKFEIS